MIRLNYFINLLNIFLIFIYFIFINVNTIKKEFEFLLISLILMNLLIKLYNWYYLNITIKKNLHVIINNIIFNDRFAKLSIFILSIVTPIFMIFQRDNLVIDLFIEKYSFFLVFIFSLLGFCLEFFILESKSNK